MLRDVLVNYREALRHWAPLLVVHLFNRLVAAAILVPLIGLLLTFSLSFSDQSALTDQDIARFLLTPAGAIGGLVVVSLIIVAAVLDVAVMTALLHQHQYSPFRSLQNAANFTIGALPRLLRVAVELLVRVLLIAAPFLILAAAVAFVALRDHDINYYLSQRPPVFIAAAVLIGLITAAMGYFLLRNLTSWAIALHLAVLDLTPVHDAFGASRKRMEGHRLSLLGRLIWWFLVRATILAIIGFIAGVLVAELPDLLNDRLKLIIGALIVVGLGWAAANAFLNAVANGALADILRDEFTRALEGRQPQAILSEPRNSESVVSSANVAIAVVGFLSIASLGAGVLMLETVGAKEEVTVIGHRGAAASRPENTMASVQKAIDDGADWVEIDVQETADGEIIVAHDSDFMKSAGVATKVWDATMDDIASIDIGSWYDPKYAEERAPLLRDVLEAARGKSKVIIELKYYGHDVDLENRVIAIVEEAGMADQIATMSLKYPAVQKMRKFRPEWRTGVLAATAVGDLSGLEGDFLAVNTGEASARLVARADAAGKDVYAWTVNDPVTMSRMITLGIDGLITDEPALARDVIDYLKSLPTAGRLLLSLADRVGAAFDFDNPEELRP